MEESYNRDTPAVAFTGKGSDGSAGTPNTSWYWSGPSYAPPPNPNEPPVFDPVTEIPTYDGQTTTALVRWVNQAYVGTASYTAIGTGGSSPTNGTSSTVATSAGLTVQTFNGVQGPAPVGTITKTMTDMNNPVSLTLTVPSGGYITVDMNI